MARTAKYYIAQHVADLFRREPKNIGVFVEMDGKISARFAGERGPADVDGRKVRNLEYPKVYVQWLKYWRRVMPESGAMDKIQRTATGHYRVFAGGAIDSVGSDSIDDVLNYLYAMLVSEGGLAEAMGHAEQPHGMPPLRESVSSDFVEAGIFGDSGLLGVRHPVVTGVSVEGETVSHEPSFVQENGQLIVMEAVDFTPEKKELVKNRAGLAAFVLHDIRQKQKAHAQAVAIVRVRAEDRAARAVAYGLQLLDKTARVVNWLDDDQRKAFIDERVRTAQSD